MAGRRCKAATRPGLPVAPVVVATGQRSPAPPIRRVPPAAPPSNRAVRQVVSDSPAVGARASTAATPRAAAAGRGRRRRDGSRRHHPRRQRRRGPREHDYGKLGALRRWWRWRWHVRDRLRWLRRQRWRRGGRHQGSGWHSGRRRFWRRRRGKRLFSGSKPDGAGGGSGVVIVRYAGDEITGVGGTGSSFVGNGTIGQTGVTYQVASFADGRHSAFNLAGVDFNNRLGASLTTAVGGAGNLCLRRPRHADARRRQHVFRHRPGRRRHTRSGRRRGALKRDARPGHRRHWRRHVYRLRHQHLLALGGLTGSRGLALGGNSLSVTQATASTYSGVVSGSGGFAKLGGGALTLSVPAPIPEARPFPPARSWPAMTPPSAPAR